MDLGGPGGNITYLSAAYNDTPGGSISVGKLPSPPPVPGPAPALGALAALAQGRRIRKRIKASRQARAVAA